MVVILVPSNQNYRTSWQWMFATTTVELRIRNHLARVRKATRTASHRRRKILRRLHALSVTNRVTASSSVKSSWQCRSMLESNSASPRRGAYAASVTLTKQTTALLPSVAVTLKPKERVVANITHSFTDTFLLTLKLTQSPPAHQLLPNLQPSLQRGEEEAAKPQHTSVFVRSTSTRHEKSC